MQNKNFIKDVNNDIISKENILKTLYLLKAQEIVSMNMGQLPNSICDFFIIAHGTSSLQVRSIAENLIYELRNHFCYRPHHVEGLQNAEWILINYGDIVIHLFLESSRRFYDLESLWADTTIEKFDELL